MQNKERNILTKYSGQALAIVLIVLVVAVIIALAILSRTMKDTRRVSSEQQSAEAVENADSALDALKDITLEEFAAFAEGGAGSTICNPDNNPNYSFLEDGCEIEEDQIDLLVDNVGGDDISAVFGVIQSDLSNQCVDETSGIRLKFESASSDSQQEISKDSVFSYVSKRSPSSPSCNIVISSTAVGDARLILSKVYATRDSDDAITGYKPYELADIRGLCFTETCTMNNWEYNNGTITVPATNVSGHVISEVRLRAIYNTVIVSATTSPEGCIDIGNSIKITAIVNCGENSRGKELVISDTRYAPELFDYVLFNGSG